MARCGLHGHEEQEPYFGFTGSGEILLLDGGALPLKYGKK